MVTTHTARLNFLELHISATQCNYLLSVILTTHSSYCMSLNIINWLASETKKTSRVFLWVRSYFVCYLDEIDFRGSNPIQSNHQRLKSEYRKTFHWKFCNQNMKTGLYRCGIKSCFTGMCSFIHCPGIISSWEGINGCYKHSMLHFKVGHLTLFS